MEEVFSVKPLCILFCRASSKGLRFESQTFSNIFSKVRERINGAIERKKTYSEIMKASKEDSKLFYKLVNKQRCTTTNATTEISYNDENFNTPSQICDGFYKYFRDLAIPKKNNTRVKIFFLSCKARNFFPEFHIRLYVKNSESDYFFVPPSKFSNIGNQNIFLEKKNITPPFKLNGRIHHIFD
jgi:hypothetical protein